MNIKSEGSSTVGKVGRKLISTANVLSSILVCTYILVMSYGHIPAEPIHIMYLGVIRLIFSNLFYSTALKEDLQALEDTPWSTTLSNHKILGPIVLFVGFLVFLILITGSMVGWYWYLTYVVGIAIIAKIHKKRIGVKFKTKGKSE